MNTNLSRIFAIIIFFLGLSNGSLGQLKSTIVHPEWVKDKVIYEVNLRQFTQSGSIREFREHLPRLKELGVGILWFMPIHPIGELNRKGTMGSYYAVKDYKGLDSYYGTLEEFRELVKEIHSMGMYIILDWVANHTAWDNPLTKTHPDFYTKDSAGNFVPPVADWSDVIDLNYDNKALWNYKADALEFWVREFNIDGYRCDVAGMVPIEFWDYATARLRKIKNVFMLAEWESPEMHFNSFNMTYGWDMHHLLNRISKGEAKASEIKDKIEKDNNSYPDNALRMQFITNHDENSWNGTEFERMGEAVKALAVLTYTIPGMPLLYTGQEIGLNRRLSFFEKDAVDWIKSDYSLFYQKLNKMKKLNPALHNKPSGGTFINVPNTQSDKVLTFLRKSGDNILLMVFNLSSEAINFEFKDVPESEFKGYFTTKTLKTVKSNKMSLRPWEYEVFISSK
ncbi:MAG: alpha-glucosidase C-terminal domain-containing protein [Ignavibacteriaceae bacterium]|nr:alpha-glucosidase C-terminal domain-containing protein [Ignavibacteriaceae bacterium]